MGEWTSKLQILNSGIQNNVADSLSRYPKSGQDIKEHDKIHSLEEFRSIFDGSLN